MDTAYSYGNERLTVERFDGWTGYYTYDPRGSVSGVTGADGYLWQSYRYDAYLTCSTCGQDTTAQVRPIS